MTTSANTVKEEVEKFLNIKQPTVSILLLLEGEGELTQSPPTSGEEDAGFGTSLVTTSHLLCKH